MSERANLKDLSTEELDKMIEDLKNNESVKRGKSIMNRKYREKNALRLKVSRLLYYKKLGEENGK